MMIRDEFIYVSMCVFFSTLSILGNLIYQKYVVLPIFPFYAFEISAGAIFYPLTFLVTDLIAEFYGKEKADFCVKLAIFANITVFCMIFIVDHLEATSWSKIDNTAFHSVFGLYSFSFIASLTACYISQRVDIRLYLWIRTLTRDRWLWVRSNCSTIISLLLDHTTRHFFRGLVG